MRTLQAWFASPLGRTLAQAEIELLERRLDRFTGWNLLQIGALGANGYVLRANTSRQWLVDLPGTMGAHCALRPERLPFQSDSMDLVVLAHSLEFSDNPHRVLREAERVLAPNGHILILAFNAMSLWGLAHTLPQVRRRGAPWCGEYFTGHRVRDWVTLLDLKVIEVEHGFFRPPLQRPRLQAHLARFEHWGSRFMPWLGGVHLTVAQKRVARLTPVRRLWLRRRRRLVAGGLVQPTSRNM